jgi:hypothetical protein
MHNIITDYSIDDNPENDSFWRHIWLFCINKSWIVLAAIVAQVIISNTARPREAVYRFATPS